MAKSKKGPSCKGFGKLDTAILLVSVMFVWSKFSSRSCTVECRRSSTNFPNSLHCSSLPKAFSCWWGQSQGSIWHHSDWSWRSWGTSWHKSRGHGASVVYAHSTSHSHLTYLYLLLSRVREGSLDPSCCRRIISSYCRRISSSQRLRSSSCLSSSCFRFCTS